MTTARRAATDPTIAIFTPPRSTTSPVSSTKRSLGLLGPHGEGMALRRFHRCAFPAGHGRARRRLRDLSLTFRLLNFPDAPTHSFFFNAPVSRCIRLLDKATGMDDIALREASGDDVAGIIRVRTSVTENLISTQRLESMGITRASLAASFKQGAKGWIVERRGQIVAFSIAHKSSQSVFALFVLPGYENCGLGRRLLKTASEWLWDNGADVVWLTTAPNTRAVCFYERCGWTRSGVEANGELRFELRRPVAG